MVHNLKIQEPYYVEVLNGNKKFEIRKNDRNYKVGDTLVLNEYKGFNKTGRRIKVKATYILYGGCFGIDKEYCVISISKI